jgi:hypothetical protein
MWYWPVAPLTCVKARPAEVADSSNREGCDDDEINREREIRERNLGFTERSRD